MRCGALRAGARQLAQLDERLLRDIGLTRSQVHAAAYGLLRLREPSPVSHIGAPPTGAANVVPLKRRAIAVRVDQAASAPLVKRRRLGGSHPLQVRHCGCAARLEDRVSIGGRSSSRRHSAPAQVRSSARRADSAATSAGSAVSTALSS
jgi:hypothetical protein